jgi:hypothetical protein
MKLSDPKKNRDTKDIYRVVQGELINTNSEFIIIANYISQKYK